MQKATIPSEPGDLVYVYLDFSAAALKVEFTVCLKTTVRCSCARWEQVLLTVNIPVVHTDL